MHLFFVLVLTYFAVSQGVRPEPTGFSEHVEFTNLTRNLRKDQIYSNYDTSIGLSTCNLLGTDATRESRILKRCFDKAASEINADSDSEICNEYNSADYQTMRENCHRNPACAFWGPPRSNKRAHQCIVNPCHQINNGQCTIQHTGGRCVWWTREQNKKFRGVDAPGCYESPCSHPIPNKPKACLAQNKLLPFEHHVVANLPREAALLEDSPYQCTWCSHTSRCVNAKPESQAQCWNLVNSALGQSNKNCTSAMGEACPNKNCALNCCGNKAWCKCAAKVRDAIFPNINASLSLYK